MTAPHRMTAAGLMTAYAGGLDPRATIDGLLARIAAHDPDLRAFTAVLGDDARAAAVESAARYAAGAPRPLEGVAVAVKANIAVEGLVTHAGTAALADMPPAATDAAAVARLRAAGAVILGQLNMHEAALGATSDNPSYGQAINPWAEGHSPGGSSGGSGAAVAAGLCTVALGTDTLGSVRIPASYCGVYGLKPSSGLVPDGGLVALAAAWDCIGPLGRSPDCLRRVLTVIAEPVAAPTVRRVALLSAVADVEQTPAVAKSYARAQAALGDLGCAVETVPFAFNLGHIRLSGFVEAALELGEDLGARLGAASPGLNASIAYARSVPADNRARGRSLLSATAARIRGILGDHDAILTPATPHPAHPHTGAMVTTAAHFTAFANVAGIPALVCPAGLDESGLPVSAQLSGRPGHDLALLDLAERLAPALGGFQSPPAYS